MTEQEVCMGESWPRSRFSHTMDNHAHTDRLSSVKQRFIYHGKYSRKIFIHELWCSIKRTSEFFDASQRVNKVKSFKHFPWYHVFVLYIYWDFFTTTHSEDWKPFNCKSKKHHQMHNLGRYSASFDNYKFFILLFVDTLICQRKDFNLKRTTKKFKNGIAKMQRKLDNLGFKNNQCENLI